jgi:hypothetical protein
MFRSKEIRKQAVHRALDIKARVIDKERKILVEEFTSTLDY